MLFLSQDESSPSDPHSHQELLEERNKLRDKVNHLEAALAKAIGDRENLMVMFSHYAFHIIGFI